jgi:glutathione S-transferase
MSFEKKREDCLMKLRYSPASPYVRKVSVVALETGLDKRIEKLRVQVAPVTVNEEVARENPLMKIPALTTDDGMVLYDSPVICEYLDSLHSGAKLFPAAGAARWTALRQQALGDGILDAALLARYEGALRPENLRWKEWSEGQMTKVRQGLAALEADVAQLSGPLTIGQITAGCALGYLDFRYPNEGWRNRHPKLAAWYEDFSKRASMQATVPQG